MFRTQFSFSNRDEKNFLEAEMDMYQIVYYICVSKKSLEEDEVTQILLIWLLQFPSEQLSEYYELGVFHEEW